jgi:predicted RNA binding protein YcfA (HicA-like mRNA interferase family)
VGKLPRPTGKEMVRFLESQGFTVVRIRGSHHFLKRTAYFADYAVLYQTGSAGCHAFAYTFQRYHTVENEAKACVVLQNYGGAGA